MNLFTESFFTTKLRHAHFIQHVIKEYPELPFTNEIEYEEAADELCNTKTSGMFEGDGDIIGFVETFKNNNKSYIVKYDTVNKLIVVYEPNKQMRHGVRVRTMYVPDTDDKYENLLNKSNINVSKIKEN